MAADHGEFVGHEATLTFEARWGQTWSFTCHYDPADPNRPCWPHDEYGTPYALAEGTKVGCVYASWVENMDPSECFESGPTLRFPMTAEWENECFLFHLGAPLFGSPQSEEAHDACRAGEFVKAPWRAPRSPEMPWYIRRVRYFDPQGRRCTTFKVRWWMRLFVRTASAPGPYFERKRDVRRWWFYPLERPKPEASFSDRSGGES